VNEGESGQQMITKSLGGESQLTPMKWFSFQNFESLMSDKIYYVNFYRNLDFTRAFSR
jgi:hypothetical protein